MNISEIKSDVLGEKCYKINHDSGLNIYVYPKENYSSTYAIIGTKYGSIDTCFKRSDSEKWTKVPEGIAHFLEHKLFESEELDAFEQYAKTGASANAYTSFDKTCYLFRCGDNLAENLKILLGFVQNPYFTAKTVEKEQGIIAQEINMYLDVAGWMSTFNLLRCLYHNHPVRIDIAGTVESIAQITDKLLYECYNTFYNLNNMVLVVVGNCDKDEIIKLCDENLKPSESLEIEKIFEDEPREIKSDYCEYYLPVGIPTFSLGFKEVCEKPISSVRELIEMDILLGIIAGANSPLYNRLLEEGLINKSFDFEFFTGFNYSCVIFEGESNDPQKVCEEIKKEIKRVKNEGIDKDLFECVRRGNYGGEIMAFNDIDTISNHIVKCEFNDYDIFEMFDCYKNVSLEDIELRLKTVLDEKYCALSIIKNKE